MKKTVAALALGAILIPMAVIAGGKYGEHRMERMTEQLQLNEQQQGEVRKIFDEQREQRRAMRDKMQERINGVLTPEQQVKWKQYREDRKQRGCDRYGKEGMRGMGMQGDHERGESPRREREED